MPGPQPQLGGVARSQSACVSLDSLQAPPLTQAGASQWVRWGWGGGETGSWGEGWRTGQKGAGGMEVRHGMEGELARVGWQEVLERESRWGLES